MLPRNPGTETLDRINSQNGGRHGLVGVMVLWLTMVAMLILDYTTVGWVFNVNFVWIRPFHDSTIQHEYRALKDLIKFQPVFGVPYIINTQAEILK